MKNMAADTVPVCSETLPYCWELDHILSQMNPVDILNPYFFKTHFNIIPQSMFIFPN
jgi:hypothetical protein